MAFYAVYGLVLYIGIECNGGDWHRANVGAIDGFFCLKKKIAWYDWLPSIIVLIGILLLVAGSQDDTAVDLFGLSLVFLVGVGFALSIHTLKAAMAQMDNAVYTATLLIEGAILSLPFALLLIDDWRPNFSWAGLLAMLYLAGL